MTRLASLALLALSALPALGQGLILGAPAQGNAGGGGGAGTVTVSGDGLSGDGSGGDPLVLDAILQELATWSTPEAGALTGPAGADVVLRAATDQKLILQGEATGDGQAFTYLEIDPPNYTVNLDPSDLGVLFYFGPSAGSNVLLTGGGVTATGSVQGSFLQVGATPGGSLTKATVASNTAYLDLKVASAGAGTATFLRLNGDTNVADVGSRQLVWGTGIGTSLDVGLVRDAAGRLRVSDASTGTEDLLADILYFTAASTSGWRLRGSSTVVTIDEGDGSDIADGDLFNFGTSTGRPSLQSNAGSASNPSFTFIGDPNTGMYRIGADNLGFATGGTQRLSIESGGGIVIGSAANASNWMLEPTSASIFSLLEGDGTALTSGDALHVGNARMCGDAGDPSQVNFGYADDPNSGLSRVEADAPAIAAEGQWRTIWSNQITLTEGTASSLVTIPLASGAAVAGSMRVFIGLTDGTNTIRMTRVVHFTACDKAGALTSSINTDGSSVGNSTDGGYVVDDGPTFTVVDGTNAISIALDVGATGTNTVTVRWSMDLSHSTSGVEVTIP